MYSGELMQPVCPSNDSRAAGQLGLLVTFGAQQQSVAEYIFTCKFAKNYWCGPLLTHKKCWTHTHREWGGGCLHSIPYHPQWIHPNVKSGHRWRDGALWHGLATQALYQPGPMGQTLDPKWSGLTSCMASLTWNTFLTVNFLCWTLEKHHSYSHRHVF